MLQYFSILAEVCQAGLNDSNPGVQRMALQAVTSLGGWATEEGHIQAVRSLLPPLLKARP